MRSRVFMIMLIAALVSCKGKKPLFVEVKSDRSHISFSNEIIENNMLNMLNYEYLYNGGGVGIGDFNNDQLPDIYFTSSLGSNKLYINKGNLQFEDVTDLAGVGGEKRWSRGVSIVDINNDGLPDIYISASTWSKPELRRNVLYVNQGVNAQTHVPRFVEMSKEYGLDDTSSTHMAAFFDYDNDGDLDVYLLVNDLNKESPNTFRPIKTDGSASNTDRLLRNDYNSAVQHPVFKDVSKEAGITWEGYGLGVNIVDINKDGWKDILVSNDYLSSDLLYINNKNGTFTNRIQEYFHHTSLNGMGNDAADINNDGLVDIVQTDMAAEDNERFKMMMNPLDYNWYLYSNVYHFPYQVLKNTLQINRGPNVKEGDSIGSVHFSEISYYSNTAYTDWSWAPLLMDADQDGYRDLMVTNGLPKDITDLDFITYRDQNQGSSPTDLLLKLPAVKISNYIYRNNGDASFTDKTKEWGWDIPSFSAGMAYADLDNDGDMDVVINNTNMPATLLENTINENKEDPHHYLRIRFRGDTSNMDGIGTMADLYYKGGHQSAELTPYRGYISSMEPVLHFGLGNIETIDSVVITWPSGKQDVMTSVKADQTLLISQGAGARDFSFDKPALITGNWFSDITNWSGIYFIHQQNDFVDYNVQKALHHKFSQYGPALAAADINADGLQDLVVGGNATLRSFVYYQQANGTFVPKPFNNNFGLQQGMDAGIAVFDADNDNDMDVYIASGGFEFESNATQYADHLYINDGKGVFSIADSSALPHNNASKSCVKAADFDGDGLIDIFIGGRVVPGNYPMPENGYLLKNNSSNGKVQFTDVSSSLAPELKNIGLITDACWSDIDNDNDPDLLITGEWMGIILFKNENGKLVKTSTSLDNEKGWWNSICAADIDNDGDMDYVLGNYGMNGYYKATATEPVSLYAKDYDNNGKIDLLYSHYRAATVHGEKKEFPALSRDQVSEQMPSIKKQYNNYSLYSKVTMSDLMKYLDREGELQLRANEMRSVWIENKGQLRFEVHALPDEAQWAPVFGMAVADYNADGNMDILLSGNDYSMAPNVGRYDASLGLLLQGDGKGNFMPLSNLQSGIFIPGDAKALIQVPVGNTICIAASQHAGPLKLFRSNTTVNVIMAQPSETSAIIELKNGGKRKQEFFTGSSFYSQSSLAIYMNASMKQVSFYKAGKLSRTIKL